MSRRIWVVSSKAFAFAGVIELLKEKEQEYFITEVEDCIWENVEDPIKDEMDNADYVYGIGMRGKKADNVVDISKFEISSKMDMKKYGSVIFNITRVIDGKEEEKKRDLIKEDSEVEKDVGVKQKEECVLEQSTLLKIEKFLNNETIDFLLGEIFIVESAVSEDKTIKILKKVYYKNDQIFSKDGYQQINGLNSDIIWKDEVKVKDYPLDLNEKIILLVNKGGFENDLEYNILKGPMLVMPDVIEHLRLARNDLEFFNLKLERSDYNKIKYERLEEKYDEKILEVGKEIEKLKQDLIKLGEKQEKKAIKLKIQELNDEILQKQGIYTALIKEKLDLEIEIKKETEKVNQLCEIGDLVNNYENEINKYKLLYYEKKIKPAIES